MILVVTYMPVNSDRLMVTSALGIPRPLSSCLWNSTITSRGNPCLHHTSHPTPAPPTIENQRSENTSQVAFAAFQRIAKHYAMLPLPLTRAIECSWRTFTNRNPCGSPMLTASPCSGITYGARSVRQPRQAPHKDLRARRMEKAFHSSPVRLHTSF